MVILKILMVTVVILFAPRETLSNFRPKSKIITMPFTYTIWVGDKINERYTLDMVVQRRTSFYIVMILASTMDELYRFRSKSYPFGHVITGIGDHDASTDSANPLSWNLYVLDSPPDVNRPPKLELQWTDALDNLQITEGQHYLYWLRAPNSLSERIVEGSENVPNTKSGPAREASRGKHHRNPKNAAEI